MLLLIWIILVCVVGLVALEYVKAKVQNLREKLEPFTYRHVSLAELGSHVQDFCRRGLTGSQLIVTSDLTDATLALEKTYEVFSTDVQLQLVATGLDPAQSWVREALDSLRRRGIELELSSATRAGSPQRIACNCSGDFEAAVVAVVTLMSACCHDENEGCLNLYVKGIITWQEARIDGTLNEFKDIFSGKVAKDGRPYKWSQYHGWMGNTFVHVLYATIRAYLRARRRRREGDKKALEPAGPRGPAG